MSEPTELKLTAAKMAAILGEGCDYHMASAFLKVLQLKGIAKDKGEKVKAISGKGKPSVIFCVPSTFNFNLVETKEKEVPNESVPSKATTQVS